MWREPLFVKPNAFRRSSALECAPAAPRGPARAVVLVALFGGEPLKGFETITQPDLLAHELVLTDPRLEGRDTPSLGQLEAARYIARCFADDQLAHAPDSLAAWQRFSRATPPDPAGPTSAASKSAEGTYFRPYGRSLPGPDADRCKLTITKEGAEGGPLVLGTDFVPVPGCEGSASGEVVFVGFGIVSKEEKWTEVVPAEVKGKIALLIESEPKHARRFEGPVISHDASAWEKVEDLAQAGAAGVVIARRTPKPTEEVLRLGKPKVEPVVGLSFRSTWASFVGDAGDPAPKKTVPMIEISAALASSLLGEDLDALAEKLDKAPKVTKARRLKASATFTNALTTAEQRCDNVVGFVKGTDEKLAQEFVVVGAHYDHLGVDPRGRVGLGADDNASGTSALIELAQAFAAAGPRRSVCFCAFSGEEDGLLGSKAFAQNLPFPRESIVAMINMDMIGRGEVGEVAVLGIKQNPKLEKLLDRARSMKATGVGKVVVRQGEDLFARSDHFSFHEIGIPVLFFFEGLPIEKNKDYHTWRDTLDALDLDKVLRTTRLVFNATWLLANDDDRPPRPQD